MFFFLGWRDAFQSKEALSFLAMVSQGPHDTEAALPLEGKEGPGGDAKGLCGRCRVPVFPGCFPPLWHPPSSPLPHHEEGLQAWYSQR